MTASRPSKHAARDDLAERLRAVMSGRDVREVAMFGGVAFMVDGRMAVSAGRDGDLLVRVDPARYPELLTIPGAHESFMGERSMAPGWLAVDRSHLDGDDKLSFWVDVGLGPHDLD
ncbi:TfoX/Sxy family protein [Jiangella alkaliphila]|uniref:TfoX N-terminal domain-containing protein n=1 Tax=Jiangella alkaliphila TaxID=419479 RepID=A0A1H2LB72_9ACTN|nr:TfoX/Sxy family protein [Jiangella alkaliphila]SDU78287.1 TfoX N-terminal domain-containing protein [Jiangella alkaliphila]